jgi:hypothetical protein
VFKRLLPTALIGYILVVLVNWGCTKLDTTTLGSDLIPVVDNVNTFADTLDIITTQGIFDDSFKITKSDNNILGKISNDPVFGTTEAQMYFQLKPSFYPYYFGNAKDTLVALDSVVLCLSYTGFWGDSSKIQRLEVLPITDQDFADTAFYPLSIKYQPTGFGTSIGAANVDIRRLGDSIRLRGDSVNNQIRIKLDMGSFASQLFGRDSTQAGIGNNNAFFNDSLFRKFYNGFAVRNTAGSDGNALMYISLTNAKTRLEVHYKKKKAGTGVLDTAFSSLVINSNDFGTNLPSVTSNYISRNYSSQVQGNVGNSFATQLYLATGPGTYANMKIPALDTIGNANGTHNRIVHRAEIYMEQDPVDFITDSIFSAPAFMYADLIDTPGLKWKPIYFDLSPNETYDPDFKKAGFPLFPGSGGIDFNYFGGFVRTRYNYLGQKVAYYTINTTRHVQQILTKGTRNYEMRLYPAYNIFYPQYTGASPISFNNPLALGRVKLKSGAYPDKQLKMRMVIIWSKLP